MNSLLSRSGSCICSICCDKVKWVDVHWQRARKKLDGRLGKGLHRRAKPSQFAPLLLFSVICASCFLPYHLTSDFRSLCSAARILVMDELFDVFEDKAPAVNGDKKRRREKRLKRQANGDLKSPGASNNLTQEEQQPTPDSSQSGAESPQHDEPDVKRMRREEPEAVVTDTFETEQSREVAASAGLQANKEAEKVILAHQIRHQVAPTTRLSLRAHPISSTSREPCPQMAVPAGSLSGGVHCLHPERRERLGLSPHKRRQDGGR